MGTVDWRDRTVTVLGLGKSGLACARALLLRGSKLILSDSRPTEELMPLLTGLPQGSVRVEGGGHSSACLDADVIVLSPGVPLDLPIIQAALADGVPVLGEIELAYELNPQPPYVVITGTNGKTTTTTLAGRVLAECGLHAPVGGNIGVPLVSLIDEPADAFVVEASSFQLETIREFRPRVAVFLNFTDDHLNRHGTRAAYLAAKCRLFENQGPEDWAVLNGDDPTVAALASGLKGRILSFSAERLLDSGICVAEGWIVQRVKGESTRVMPLSEIKLRGRHNLENCLATVAIAAALALPAVKVRGAIAAFLGVEHRIESVGTIEGIEYINDSKGTNYASTLKAIEAFEEPIVLILGGKDKGGDFQVLAEGIRKRVKHVILMGEAGPHFERVLQAAGYEATSRVELLSAALEAATSKAAPGDVVLFSPACASFDQFRNYEERGSAFKSLVHALAEPAAHSA